MIISFLMRFLGTDQLPPLAQRLIFRFIVLASLQTSLYLFSSTFCVLFVIDYVGFQTLGLLLVVSVLLQAILDYPSGVLGDWLGQRWVLTISFISYGLSYGLLVLANSNADFLLIYVLIAFARSQESGTLDSWFDNNYKAVVKEIDVNRTIYQEFLGKKQSVIGFLGAMMIVLGGFIATIFFRRIVFLIQSIGMFIIAGLCLTYVSNFPEVTIQERSFHNYFNLMKKGLSFVLSSKNVFFLVLSICLWNVCWKIWLEMLLFPIYFGYTGSDVGSGILRFIGWILGSIFAGMAGKWSNSFNIRKWIPRLNLLILLPFFTYFFLLTSIYPLKNCFNLAPIVLLLSYFVIFLILNNIFLILRQRFIFDLVPDSNRNSIYSLFPTLTLLISSPFLFISGSVIDIYGISLTLILPMIIGIFSSISMFLSFRYYAVE